jgi:hypothetical protein
MNEQDRTRAAYRSAGKLTRDRIANESPLDAEALAAVEAHDVIVVTGQFDHVERVLEALEMPFTKVSPEQMGQVPLSPHQLLVVNCPGNIQGRDVARIADFVGEGGSLFTTDWALKHVIEPAFPGVLSYNNRPTKDDVVRIEIVDRENPFLRGVLEEGDDPQWWLEASSYPIHIHAPDRVRTLLRSKELGNRYGETPVAVLFDHGRGEVFHMISHYYLQRTELRSARHFSPASAWADVKGVAVAPSIAADMADLSLGEVESASSSARLFANVVAAKKRKDAR